jgi:glutamyl-tRNA synthetase
MPQEKTVRTRMAPSPTGEDLHIGNLYTALLNWTFAKKNKGQFIIRIEDTDRERLVEGSEDKILTSFKKFGLNYDEGPDIGGPFAPYRQSERLELYKKYALELVEKGVAYYCICSRERLQELRDLQTKEGKPTKYDKHCLSDQEHVKEEMDRGTPYVIRLNILPGKKMWFKDLIRGEISIPSDDIDDQVLLKSDGYPTYHLGVVVDDHLMEITHVIRAEEWISSTPKHVLLYEAFGWELPIFAHGPKLSKRKNPVWASWYLEEGFLPEVVLNYLALMGWSHPEGKEIFSLEEFVEKFELKNLKAVGPAFDIKKLEWMNGEYIRMMSDQELEKRLHEYLVDHPAKSRLMELIPLVKERIKKLSDFIPLTDWIFNPVEYDKQFFDKVKVDNISDVLQKILEKMESLEKPWKKEEFEQTFQSLAQELGLNNTQMFQLIRVAVSGQLVSPPLFESLQILGEDEAIKRVKEAIKFLKNE